MGLFIFALGFLGGIVFIVRLVIDLIKGYEKRNNLIGLAICFAMFLGGALLMPEGDVADNMRDELDIESGSVGYNERKIKKVVTKAVGKDSYIGIEPMNEGVADNGVVINIDYDTLLGGTKGIAINLNNMEKIFKEVSEMPEVGSVMIDSYAELTGAYGDASDRAVLSVRLDRDTLDKITWENFDRKNFVNIADFYYQHPALTN